MGQALSVESRVLVDHVRINHKSPKGHEMTRRAPGGDQVLVHLVLHLEFQRLGGL